MPIPSGVDQKKSKVYVQKHGGDYIQILPESFCESEILEGSMWPVSSHALKQYSKSIEERIAPFAGATATTVGKIGTVPEAKSSERSNFLRGDGKWVQIVITDERVKAFRNGAKRFYVTGTDIGETNTGVAYFDPGVYVSEASGDLHAVKFTGNLEGNVKGNLEGTASKATADSNGNNIANTYATKAALQSGYAPLGHKHNASEVNALTGYSKGSSTAAISASDSLNQALGKLEKKLDGMSALNSPSFTGTPTAPNIGSNSGDGQIANKKYVDDRISGLVNGAGSALDTLKELANALGNDANFASTMTTKLGTKLDKTSANYIKTISISDNTAGTGQILKLQRGDDTTYNLTIKDTVIYPAAAAPKTPAATAAVGTSVKYAREDHVHPLQTIISATPSGTSWVTGVQAGKALVSATTTSYGALLNAPTKNYRVGLSTYPSSNDLVYLYSVTNANVSAGTNTTAKALTWNAATGELIADSFKGNLNGTATACSGNAASATKATQDGDGKVISSTYVKNTGGTITGTLDLTRTTDAQGTGTAAPALRIGALTGTHLEFDGNEIMAKASGNTVGPLYINSDGGQVIIGSGGLKVNGTITGNISGSSTSCSGNAATASKLGTTTVGSASKPIYLNGGTATAISATVGSASKPVYLNGGTITACGSTVGSATKPVYMNGGAITASNATVGSASKPVYLNGGTITACSNVSGNPTGTVIWYSGTSAPSGYLVCNGQAVSRTTYADLYKVIGTRFGSGNGSSTFNVPNLIDRFIEGNATPGIVKNAGLPNITARFPGGTHANFGWGGATYYDGSIIGLFHVDMRYYDSCVVQFNASRCSGIYGASSTVQPPALTMLPCIKT